MNKKLLAAIALLIFIVLFGFISYQPAESEVTYNPVSAKLRATLVYAGINSIVDVSDGRAVIIFNLPEDMGEEESVYYVMEIATEMTNSEEIVVRVCENYEPVREYVVDREEYAEFVSGKKSFEELETLQIKSFI